MKIAAAAYPIDWHNRWNDYVGKLRVWVRTAAEQGAELLVFPEHGALELASLAGEDNARDLRRAIDAVSARIKDVDELHGSLAREFKVHIFAASGPIRREDGKAVNRARLFAPDGSHGHQDKVMLSRFEREDWGLEPGSRAAGLRDRARPDRRPDRLRRRVPAARAGDGRGRRRRPSSCPPAPRTRAATGGSGPARRRGRSRTSASSSRRSTVGEAGWLPPAARNTGAAGVYGPPDLGFPRTAVVAVGKTDAAGWVHAEVAAEAVRKVRTEGAVLTLFDWPRQAGAAAAVEMVPLGAA